MPKLTAVAVAILAALPLAGLHLADQARATSPIFTLPPFHVGDTASYTDSSQGNFTITVGAPTPMLDKSLRTVEMIPATYAPWNDTEFFSARTMTLEVKSGCGGDAPGSQVCLPLTSWNWWDQGTPAVLGATYLQGRSFQIGDTWNLTGACGACTTRTVSIEAPNNNSPPGTDFVARIGGDYPGDGFRGRIHMSAQSPFPLLVQSNFFPFASRLGTTPGGAAIQPPSPPEDAAYPPGLPVLPLDHGRPVEGTPLPGWPSWSDARNLSLPDDAETNPNARFVSLYFPSGTTRPSVDEPTPGFATATSYEIRAEYAIPGSPDSVWDYNTLRLDQIAGNGFQNQTTYTPGQQTTAPPSSSTDCLTATVPLWDTVRVGLALPYLHDFKGFSLETWNTCRVGDFEIEGEIYYIPDCVGLGCARQEVLDITATTGYLNYALSIDT